MNAERTFVIAAPCAGVNFLITAFLLLPLGRLRGGRARAGEMVARKEWTI